MCSGQGVYHLRLLRPAPEGHVVAPLTYTRGMTEASVRELIFEVHEAPEGGYTARALGESIFAEADDWTELEGEIRDAVECHYPEGERPALVRPFEDSDTRSLARPARISG